ncbi:NAD(P)-dependent oxidoreductase [Maribacter sp. 4G9]|uniref:NAD(P)-dependent oxidoreductase n=1 Tax=Maribacter sp. 4G9 TaxID=1889777 RepID=UPI000C14C380|nr:NAD(P)H-binding protein [Maribacter sp. 4G9]PIB39384.1 epimerase [Maribacter sp. 4G9]
MTKHKIAVLGGTGKSGTYLVRRLLELEIPIKLLIRNPEKHCFTNPLVEVVKGDARDYNSVLDLIDGCHAVISALGQPKGEPPISKDASKNVVNAMRKNNLKRYIVVTGLNVDSPFDKKDEKTSYATQWMYENFPDATKNRQEEYAYLTTQEGVDWTLVRLPMIIQTEEKHPVQVSLENCKGDKISATDLADFLIAQLDNESYIQKCPFLFSV